jgi:hemerythrin-like domain-containing protein
MLHTQLPSDNQIHARQAMAMALSLDPFDFIRLHHRLQQGICSAMSLVAHDLHHSQTPARALTVLDYLAHELPHHRKDETGDLRRTLEDQELPSSDISGLFDLVEAAHERDHELAEQVMDDLATLARGGCPAEPFPFILALLQLSESLSAHVEWEDRVILPLAEESLSAIGRTDLIACMGCTPRRAERHPEGNHVMKRFLLTAYLVLFIAAQAQAAPGPDVATDRCLLRPDLVALLVTEFGEQLVEVHPTSRGLLEFHVSPIDGTWTAVLTDGGGTSCVIAAGNDVDPSKTLLGQTFLEI